MRAHLKLECIGLNTRQQLQHFDRICQTVGFPQEELPRFAPWVAEARIGQDGGIYFHYLYGKRDYSQANSKGSRFVYENYILEEDRLYRVCDRTSWKSTREYWVAVTPDGGLYELSDAEAAEWLSSMT